MGLLANIWHGREGLAKTYWGYGVVGSIVPGIALGAVKPGSVSTVIVVLLVLAYLVLVNVGIWRAAGYYKGPKSWALLARVVVVIFGIPSIFGVAMVLAMPKMDAGRDFTPALEQASQQAAPYTSPPGYVPFTGKLDGEK